MKYKDLIQFEPINEVVKLERSQEKDYKENLVKTFVFSNAYREALIPTICRTLDYSAAQEGFGLQIVGNYGTGKSHLMSLISILAEDVKMMEMVNEESVFSHLEKIAGKYRVLRFELGHSQSLWEIITFKIEAYLKELGVEYSFKGDESFSYQERLRKMMAAFEIKHPDYGFLVVVDEMLAYLKGRSTADKLNLDLQVLQALGQVADGSRFRVIFGVQEKIYESTEFQFAADMLSKVSDRYRDLTITKEDVSFIVQNRLLKKDEHQKAAIRKHLEPFQKYFIGLHGRLEEFVELFPVHPSYFDNFRRIRLKSQREILRTLSERFSHMQDEEVAANDPALICYDSYWDDIIHSSDLMANPDVRRVRQAMEVVEDKIDTFFTAARASKKTLARRIAHAAAIKLLQADLPQQNGTTAEQLVEELCPVMALADDREFLIDAIGSVAKNIISATSGQYFDQNRENEEFFLRIEGGINFDQKIEDYALNMEDWRKDEYFFKFLEVALPLDYETYRSGFKIWAHELEWKSHKAFRQGYIFFGYPDEKSTTHPQQHYYLYFLPIFASLDRKLTHTSDEVYFLFDGLSEEFREVVTRYGAALALQGQADSSQKPFYQQKTKQLLDRARNLFDAEYLTVGKVDYKGKVQPLNGFPNPGSGAGKDLVLSQIAATLLDDHFIAENPDYPQFKQLGESLTTANFARSIKSALNKINRPEQPDRTAEAILNGLGLWEPGQLVWKESPYARYFHQQLKEKGPGKVLNRDEILIDRNPYGNERIYVSEKFELEAEFSFLVLATLAALGEAEIVLHSGETINANQLHLLTKLDPIDYWAFSHIKAPKDLNRAVLRELFIRLLGRDLSRQLHSEQTFLALNAKAEHIASESLHLVQKVRDGYQVRSVTLVTPEEGMDYRVKLMALKGFADELQRYNSEAKLKNFKFSKEEVVRQLEALPLLEKLKSLINRAKNLEQEVSYLMQAKQYLSDGELKKELENTINAIPEQIAREDPESHATFQKRIDALKKRYAEYYLSEYLRHRISEKEDTQKLALMDSEAKYLCDVLKEAEFLPTSRYQGWLDDLGSLQKANPGVNLNAILELPFQDNFNPKALLNQAPRKVDDLKEELGQLLSQWTEVLRGVVDDPVVKKNLTLLNQSEQELVRNFGAGKVNINRQNVLKLRKAIEQLNRGLDRVDLNPAELRSAFQKPMTQEEAVEAFKRYLDKLTVGKEREKVRIVWK